MVGADGRLVRGGGALPPPARTTHPAHGDHPEQQEQDRREPRDLHLRELSQHRAGARQAGAIRSGGASRRMACGAAPRRKPRSALWRRPALRARRSRRRAGPRVLSRHRRRPARAGRRLASRGPGSRRAHGGPPPPAPARRHAAAAGPHLDDEAIKAEVAEVVAAEVAYLRFVGLDKVAGRYATEKMVRGWCGSSARWAAIPNIPCACASMSSWRSSSDALQDDPELRMKGEAVKQELLAHPALTDYLHGLWSQAIAWMQGDLGAADSTCAARSRSARARSVRSSAPMQRCRAGSTSRSGRRRRAGSSAIARTFASTSSPASPTGTRPR